ncbi:MULTISPECIES: hypothetical protein [unclassified Sphingopyxis]|uniref:hypothetical protein n=1 Tax=unclassified Sphingopyxis TaxID=2614943 RepID=UPI000A9DD11C|nr:MULTISPECIES: hypothetical protein [unclassified Sphingopyxis]
MADKPASLPPVPGALDPIVQHFLSERHRGGHVPVAPDRADRRRGGCHALRRAEPAGIANFGQTHAFMNDEKRILIFSKESGCCRFVVCRHRNGNFEQLGIDVAFAGAEPRRDPRYTWATIIRRVAEREIRFGS